MELKKSFVALRRRLKSGKKYASHPMALHATNQEKIPHLPMDIMIEILSRLPAKSIMNCRKVCKLWKAITTTSHFSVIYSKHSVLKRPTILTFDHCSNTITVIDYVSWEIILKMKKHTNEYLEFQGSCNGVLCIYNVKLASIELLNPMTCESIIIPQPITGCDFRFNLGFDPSSNKFKVLCRNIVQPSSRGYIYTVGDSTWRLLKKNPYTCLKETVYSNGALHWLGITGQRSLFYTLNLKDETIASIDITETLGRPSIYEAQLCELEGRIWISQYRENSTERRINMFIMGSDHDKIQWILMYTIKRVPRPLWILHPSPLIIVPNEKIILCNWDMNWLIRYNIQRCWWRRNFKICYDLLGGSLYTGQNCKERKDGYEKRRRFGSCIPFRESLMALTNDAAFKPPIPLCRPPR